VRPFSRPCGDNSICADNESFRAGQIPFRAGKNQSVRPLFDLCGQKSDFFGFLTNGGGQKATVEVNWQGCGRETLKEKLKPYLQTGEWSE
jgi:hypothetical protein